MRKKWFYVLLLLLIPVMAACGGKDSSGVDKANEAHDPGQQRLDAGNIQAVMDDTRAKISRSDMKFLTYRYREGVLRVRVDVHNEEKQEEIVRTFADAFQNTDAKTLDLEVKGKGDYSIPLEEDYSDLAPYYTPK